MTYFSLRKRAPEPEPDDTEEELEETADEAPEEQPGKSYGPLLTGLLGPIRWLAARFGTSTAWGVHGMAAWAIGYYRGWAAAGIVAVWLLAVLLFVPREVLDRFSDRIEGHGDTSSDAPDEAVKDTTDANEKPAPPDPYTVLIGWLDELTRGRSGIHLDELHQALTRHPQLAGLKRSEMRAWLGRHHIAVERTLRVGSVAGRSGVSRVTVEALLKALPPLLESGGADSPVHASDVQDSPVESGVERGVERAV